MFCGKDLSLLKTLQVRAIGTPPAPNSHYPLGQREMAIFSFSAVAVNMIYLLADYSMQQVQNVADALDLKGEHVPPPH